MGRDGARPCPLAVFLGLPPGARPADHPGPEHCPIPIPYPFPECSPRTHGPSPELRKQVSGARTRGPRPVSTQVDGGGVCSSSTVGPSLPAVQPQVLLPRGLVSQSSGDPLPPGRAQPDVDPVQGFCGAACTMCGLGFSDLPLCLEGGTELPLPAHAPAIVSPAQLRGEQADRWRGRTMQAVQRCGINRRLRIKVRGLIPVEASVLGAGPHSWRFCPCTALI